MNDEAVKTPVHLWIVGIVALLWNAVGAFDYSATQYRMESYMSQFTPEQLAYFYGFPAWVVASWALAVWGALIGSLALLARRKWAVWLFALAVAGLALTTLHNFALSNGAAIMGTAAAVFTVVIWVIALFLLFYARAMSARGVLR